MNENNGSSPNFPDEGTEDEGLEHQDSKNDMTDIAGMKTLTSRITAKAAQGHGVIVMFYKFFQALSQQIYHNCLAHLKSTYKS